MIRCVYTDLDGTLLGRGGSLFRDAEGSFSLLGPRRGFKEDGSPYGPHDWPILRSLVTGETVERERANVVRPDGS